MELPSKPNLQRIQTMRNGVLTSELTLESEKLYSTYLTKLNLAKRITRMELDEQPQEQQKEPPVLMGEYEPS